MVYYRLYLLADPDGRFVGFEEIDAPDDVEAVRLAERHRGRHPLELWCGQRRVKTLPAVTALEPASLGFRPPTGGGRDRPGKAAE